MGKKKLFKRIVAGTILSAMITSQVAYAFTDVKDGDWFKQYVDYAADKGIMVGTGDSFEPNKPLTRAAGVQVLYAMEGKPDDENSDAFDDLTADWYKDAVNWAAEHHVVAGMGNGKFNPDASLTREAIATIMKAYAFYKGYDVSKSADLSSFSDAGDVDSWAKEAMKWAVGAGIIAGKTVNGQKALCPKDATSRAEYATIAKAFQEKVVNSGSQDTGTVETQTEYDPHIQSGEKTELPEQESNISDAHITRYEWVDYLLDATGASDAENTIDEDNIVYPDVDASTDEGRDVALAYQLGYLGTVGDDIVVEFDGDSEATREFAAFTAMRAMHYDPSLSASSGKKDWCSDYSELEFPEYDAIAVENGYIDLDGEAFRPKDVITEDAANQILKTVRTFLYEDDHIGGDSYADITYQDNVKRLISTDYQVTENNGEYTAVVPIGSITKNLQKDDILVLSKAEDNPEYVIKVESVEEKDGKIVVKGKTPELSEVFKSIDVSLSGNSVDFDDIQLADGITATYTDESGTVYTSGTASNSALKVDDEAEADSKYYVLDGEDMDSEESYSVTAGRQVSREAYDARIGGTVPLGKLSFDFGDGIKLGSHAKLKGGFEISVPRVTAVAEGDLLHGGLNECTLAADFENKLTGKIEVSTSQFDSSYSESGSIAKELGRVPVQLGWGFNVSLVLYLVANAKGELEIAAKLTDTVGFQYKNGDFRNLSTAKLTVDPAAVSVSAKFGAKEAINFSFVKIDIAGIDAENGVGFKGSLNNHLDVSPHLSCIDSGIYLYLDLGLNKDTLASDVISVFNNKGKYDPTIHVFDDKTSPVKLKVHFENQGNGMHKVEACTYGTGTLTGKIIDAESGNPINNAKITVYKDDYKEKTKNSDASGNYRFAGLSAAKYTFIVTAKGYRAYRIDDVDVASGNSYAEDVELIPVSSADASSGSNYESGNGTESYSLSGKFLDAKTGNVINNVRYKIRLGWNASEKKTVIKSGETTNGTYQVALAPGHYTITAYADGYINSSENITALKNKTSTKNIIISDSASDTRVRDLRVVLQWSNTPSDLDSHFFGPYSDDSSSYFHTYYSQKNAYYGGKTIAALDVDCTSGRGPETTTLYKPVTNGKYSFFVHDYSNRGNSSDTKLSSSQAYVTIYDGQKKVMTVHVPAGQTGTIWHVFDYNASTQHISLVNTFANAYDYHAGNSLLSVENDEQVLEEDTEEELSENLESDSSFASEEEMIDAIINTDEEEKLAG